MDRHGWLCAAQGQMRVKFRCVGMIPCGPCLELLGFFLPLGQFNGVQRKWLQSIAPPNSPGGSWCHILSLFSMPIVLAVVVSSNNLVLRVGTIGMQCDYYTCLSSISLKYLPIRFPCLRQRGPKPYPVQWYIPVCHRKEYPPSPSPVVSMSIFS